jgi:hypothetical protein
MNLPSGSPREEIADEQELEHLARSSLVAHLVSGAQGIAAIYTGAVSMARGLRCAKISIRAHSWFNWLYPINF